MVAIVFHLWHVVYIIMFCDRLAKCGLSFYFILKRPWSNWLQCGNLILNIFFFLSCSSNRHQRRVHENNRENSLGSSFRGRKRSTRSPSTTGEGSGGGVAGGAGSHAVGDVQRRRDRRQRREAKPPVNYDHHQPAARRRSTPSSPHRQVGLSFSL